MKMKFNQSNIKLAIAAGMALGTVALSVPAYATEGTANLSVSASIGTACTITTTNLAFGAYDAVVANAATALTATGGVTSTCSVGSSSNIKMGQGLNADADSSDSIPLRRMVAGLDATSFLDYSVFSNSGMTDVWENATGVAYTGSGTSQDLVVYGSVPADQTDAVVGSYTDTLVVTINY